MRIEVALNFFLFPFISQMHILHKAVLHSNMASTFSEILFCEEKFSYHGDWRKGMPRGGRKPIESSEVGAFIFHHRLTVKLFCQSISVPVIFCCH